MVTFMKTYFAIVKRKMKNNNLRGRRSYISRNLAFSSYETGQFPNKQLTSFLFTKRKTAAYLSYTIIQTSMNSDNVTDRNESLRVSNKVNKFKYEELITA